MNLILEISGFLQFIIILVNGIELEVFEAGQQYKGKLIVFCYGWLEYVFVWWYQILVFVQVGYYVIVFNQRGYGNLLQLVGVMDYDIVNLMDDLVVLFDYYGYVVAIFVGYDWGVNVVWSLV